MSVDRIPELGRGIEAPQNTIPPPTERGSERH